MRILSSQFSQRLKISIRLYNQLMLQLREGCLKTLNFSSFLISVGDLVKKFTGPDLS